MNLVTDALGPLAIPLVAAIMIAGGVGLCFLIAKLADRFW